jgi:hypothetical protein
MVTARGSLAATWWAKEKGKGQTKISGQNIFKELGGVSFRYGPVRSTLIAILFTSFPTFNLFHR